MNMIVSVGAFTRIAPFAGRLRARAQSVPVPDSTSHLPRRTLVRARWSLDPVSGRLQCAWVSEDEVPDSRRCRHHRPMSQSFGDRAVALLAA